MDTQESPTEPEALATFKIRYQSNVDMDEVLRLSDRMHEIAKSTPTIGAIEADYWTDPDGASLVTYRFKSMAALNEFVRHPEHQDLMRRGKEFFKSVDTQIATIVRRKHTEFGK